MASKLTEAVNEFSRKFSRFTESADSKRVEQQPKTQEELLQNALRERIEQLKDTVVSTYKIYRAPLEALGSDSNRANSIQKDELSLFKAYNIYKTCMELNADETEELSGTYIKNVQIHSPLADKASYTMGGQFVYLAAWLFFEKSCADYMPLFKEDGRYYELIFVPTSEYTFQNHDKDIFEIIKTEFYS